MSLDEHKSLSGTSLTFGQRPGAPWMFVAFALIFPTMFVAPAFFLPVLFFGIFIAAFARTRVEIELTATRMRLKGWTGRVPLPREHVLPLHGLQVETRSNWKVNGVRHHTLVFDAPDGSRVLVPVLAIDRQALETIRARIEQGTAEADVRHGDGAAEVPAELRRVLEDQRPD